MSEETSSKPDHDASESLWAISNEGTIWQINPLSGNAAPVLNLDEMPAPERQSFQRHVMRSWAGRQGRESIPDDIEQLLERLTRRIPFGDDLAIFDD